MKLLFLTLTLVASALAGYSLNSSAAVAVADAGAGEYGANRTRSGRFEFQLASNGAYCGRMQGKATYGNDINNYPNACLNQDITIIPGQVQVNDGSVDGAWAFALAGICPNLPYMLFNISYTFGIAKREVVSRELSYKQLPEGFQHLADEFAKKRADGDASEYAGTIGGVSDNDLGYIDCGTIFKQNSNCKGDLEQTNFGCYICGPFYSSTSTYDYRNQDLFLYAVQSYKQNWSASKSRYSAIGGSQAYDYWASSRDYRIAVDINEFAQRFGSATIGNSQYNVRCNAILGNNHTFSFEKNAKGNFFKVPRGVEVVQGKVDVHRSAYDKYNGTGRDVFRIFHTNGCYTF